MSAKNALDAEPLIASFLKSMLTSGGPVNAAARYNQNTPVVVPSMKRAVIVVGPHFSGKSKTIRKYFKPRRSVTIPTQVRFERWARIYAILEFG
jgi:hypothetical protein